MSVHQARKRFGQHFLVDQVAIERIASAIYPEREQFVLEIGPGLGALTGALLLKRDHLVAVEIDRDLIGKLKRRFGDRLTLHEADALGFDYSSLPNPIAIVGNLPYNISSPLLIALLPIAARVSQQVFMLQKEVVDRIVAEPCTKAYGRLTVMLQARYSVESLFTVGPQSFDPPPKVNSAIIRMIPLAHCRVNDWSLLEKMLAQAFSQRRKMLRAYFFKWLKEQYQLDDCGLEPTARAEQISVQDWIELSNRLGATS
jgi:16S rRNA (adenine1518-N6/adenine1519-N6)-dimethyltransferase